jgi:cell division protein ZapE
MSAVPHRWPADVKRYSLGVLGSENFFLPRQRVGEVQGHKFAFSGPGVYAPEPMVHVIKAYENLLAAGELRVDAEQRLAAAYLDGLAAQLAQPPAKPGLLGWLFGAGPPPLPRGLYLWGKVGRGKSFLMDLFYDHAAALPKRRVHFHAFMLDVHARLHHYRQHPIHGDDPIPPTARDIAAEARLLCFDEMQVSDIADAMILGRLFTALFALGVCVVTTSNRPPDDLYKDGLNRALFLPFIELLKQQLDIMSLNGPTDYRLERLSGVQVYHVPNGVLATTKLSQAFFKLTDHLVEDRATVPSEILQVQGRQLYVPKALKGVAVFSFKRLCDAPLGAADYLAIAQRFHTVIIVGIPKLSADNRNQAKRFVTLIDALCDHKVKLLCAADAPPQQLYPAGDGSFEFERTVSRLMEMQSAAYLALGHGRA